MSTTNTKISIDNLSIYYGSFRALADVSMPVYEHQITAIIGPSGCGKSTLLRSINRMNDLVEGCRVEGRVILDDNDIYRSRVDAVRVRQQVGMVFQKPNPFPRSIYENVAFGARHHGIARGKQLDDWVEHCLRRVALWDEVKDKLMQSGAALSGGQQQRLCIARTIALEPDVILMDEPCAALDPIATAKIEELLQDLKNNYTIAIVTHNMQQAARISDYTAMMFMRPDRAGQLVEFTDTSTIFTQPKEQRTQDYISGRFG